MLRSIAGRCKLPFSRFAAGALAASAGVYVVSQQPVHAAPATVNWDSVRQDLAQLAMNEEAYNAGADNFPGAVGGGGHVGPMLVRLAWHSAGTFCPSAGNGGSNGGTMRFAPEANHGANAGLAHARNLIEAVKRKHPAASYADLYVLAGCVAIEEMGGPKIGFTPGRTDAQRASTPQEDARFSPDGRLPAADTGDLTSTASHLRDVFYRMGFNDQEIVALAGAHALGHCHTDRSGYWGPWTKAPNFFSNEYFRNLFDLDWTVKKTHQGGRWEGPLQYENEDGSLMMLPADLTMVYDASFKKYAKLYKDDEERFFADFAAAFQKLMELGFKA